GNGSRQRHSSPSSLASGSSTDETGPPHRIPDSPRRRRCSPFGSYIMRFSRLFPSTKRHTSSCDHVAEL
ncbi:hypothetical protein CN200_26575, partial [Sinorhizobium meliloti]